jgi:hypothetical protein
MAMDAGGNPNQQTSIGGPFPLGWIEQNVEIVRIDAAFGVLKDSCPVVHLA